MKSIVSGLFAFTLLAPTLQPVAGSRQGSSLAYISVQRILSESNDAKAASKKLEDLRQAKGKDIAARQKALEATRLAGTKAQSNIRWNYGHETIPRHLRDVFVTEYGVADVRGKSDTETIAAMLAVSDSRFQAELARIAKDAGKLPKDFQIPLAHRENFPERVAAAIKPAREAGLLPSFPFGSDFTETEQRLIPALQVLQEAQRTPLRLPGLLWEGFTRQPDAADDECLARLDLDRPATLAERAYRALVSAALARSRAG